MKTLTNLTLAIICTLLTTTVVAEDTLSYQTYLPNNYSCVDYVKDYEKSLKLPVGYVTWKHKVQLSWLSGYMTGTNVGFMLLASEFLQRATMDKEASIDLFQDYPIEVTRRWVYQWCRVNLPENIADAANELQINILAGVAEDVFAEHESKIGEIQ